MNFSNTPYQVFGSADSIDFDIVFFVDELKTIHENLIYSKKLSSQLSPLITSGKRVNANLATIDNGVLTKVYKGTTDELNNALFFTYQNHQQGFELQITRLLPRNNELKLRRTMIKILSFFTRTEHRKQIKLALRNGFAEQLKILQMTDLITLRTGNPDIKDVWKIIAFSIAQVTALDSETEIYSKKEVIHYAPELHSIIERATGNHESALKKILSEFIHLSEKHIKNGMVGS